MKIQLILEWQQESEEYMGGQNKDERGKCLIRKSGMNKNVMIIIKIKFIS